MAMGKVEYGISVIEPSERSSAGVLFRRGGRVALLAWGLGSCLGVPVAFGQQLADEPSELVAPSSPPPGDEPSSELTAPTPAPPLTPSDDDSSPDEELGHSPQSAAATNRKSADTAPSFRVHTLLLGAKALRPYQSREFGFGGAALGAVGWGPSPVWSVQVELGFVALGSSKKDAPEGLAELGGATGGHLATGLRINPFSTSSLKKSLGGLWLSGAAGASVTGGSVAPVLDALLGYDFKISRQLSLGPALGYLLVLQTDKDGPRPENAHIGLFGLNGSFDFASASARPKDRDNDGILDKNDACPEQPEDRDGFEDEDGCPELDNDQDRIPDLKDRCPLEPEDRDGFEDGDGCADDDNDADKILDVDDECPLEPEDHDDFLDEDGCPDLDNDGDKIPDLKDLCPNEPEIVNGIADNDGCPDSESVRVVGDKIELDQKIHFWTNSHVIRGMSYPVLDKLARFLKEHTEYVKIDIEGHADQRGDEEFNVDLSRRRAQSIREFLAKRGIEEARLASEGFGSSRPLVDANNEGAWFMNRRVEFVVTRNRKVKVITGVPGQGDTGPAFGRDKKEPLDDAEEEEQ